MSKFSGFISRCTIFLECKNWTAWSNYNIINLTSRSVSYSIKSSTVVWQYSNMKYIRIFRLNASISLTTNGCLEAHSIWTSRYVIFRYEGSLRSSGSLKRLIATTSFVYLFLHLITTPYVPSPIYSICSYFCMVGVLKLESQNDKSCRFFG